jgi:hypothetical protein
MYHQSPIDRLGPFLALSPQSIAASSAVNGTIVDLQGWSGVVFILALGAVDGTQDMKAQSDDAVGFGSPTDITGAAITQVTATGDDKIYVLDVPRPAERFVRCVVTNGAGAVADFQQVTGLLYGRTGVLPATAHASVGEIKKA